MVSGTGGEGVGPGGGSSRAGMGETLGELEGGGKGGGELGGCGDTGREAPTARIGKHCHTYCKSITPSRCSVLLASGLQQSWLPWSDSYTDGY